MRDILKGIVGLFALSWVIGSLFIVWVVPVDNPTERSVQVLSSPSGVRIEVNGKNIGKTPLNIEIRYLYGRGLLITSLEVVAYPAVKGQYLQKKEITKITDSGGPSPKVIDFDMFNKPNFTEKK